MEKLKATVMDGQAMLRAVTRMAHEIIEKNGGSGGLCLIGIKRRGQPLAEMLRDAINSFEGVMLPTASVDITLYRDDLSEISSSPILNNGEIPFPVSGRKVVLVDDVIFTGRTARAAMEAVLERGRPSCIQLAALIDRGHRELPIRPDFVGKNIPTSRNEKVAVCLPSVDGEMCVRLYDISE